MSQAERDGLGIARYPEHLGQALDELERSELFHDVFGDEFMAEYLTLKRFAWNEYLCHVSDWETALYAKVF